MNSANSVKNSKAGILRRLAAYYKPYRKVFWTDMFFAFVSAAAALVIPLIVRYVTSTIVNMQASQAQSMIFRLGIVMIALVLIQWYSNYYISNYGHVMGANIEYDMRAEIFDHYQKMSFSFYDEQKVGQLMSRVTSDLFEITELLHHGPENIAISLIKIVGAFLILISIQPYLALIAFALIPVMILFAYFYNKRMKLAFRKNREKIAEINSQIEDNLSGIRVVKSFANEEIENAKFQTGNDGFLSAKENSYHYMGHYHSGLTAFTTLINVLVIFFWRTDGDERNRKRHRSCDIFVIHQCFYRSSKNADRFYRAVSKRIFGLRAVYTDAGSDAGYRRRCGRAEAGTGAG